MFISNFFQSKWLKTMQHKKSLLSHLMLNLTCKLYFLWYLLLDHLATSIPQEYRSCTVGLSQWGACKTSNFHSTFSNELSLITRDKISVFYCWIKFVCNLFSIFLYCMSFFCVGKIKKNVFVQDIYFFLQNTHPTN